MPIKTLDRHHRVTIMGLGRCGGAAGAARFWSELGAEVTVTDLLDAEALAPSLEALAGTSCKFVLGGHREEDFRSADLVVVNPAVKPDNEYVRLARNAGAEIRTEVGLVFRVASGPVIGVTGSNGKSTTTALLGEMLRAHDPRVLIGGNLGGSLLPDLKAHAPAAPIVLELSSFQLHYLKPQRVSPSLAVVSNLTPNHLDWHRTVLNYYEDKRNILHYQNAEDTAVLNAEDPTLREWAKQCRGRTIMVSREDPGVPDACFLRGQKRPGGGGARIVVRLAGQEADVAPLEALRLPGAHNEINALLAAAAAYAYAQDAAAVRQGLEEFRGLPHRLEEIGTVSGVRFVNDSMATTPEAVICALATYAEPKVLIAGGLHKGGDLTELGKAIARQAHAVILIGVAAPAIRAAVEEAAAECGSSPLLVEAGADFEMALRQARELCPPGGVALLSPACASYDMFANFEERGERFRAIVREMAATSPGHAGTGSSG